MVDSFQKFGTDDVQENEERMIETMFNRNTGMQGEIKKLKPNAKAVTTIESKNIPKNVKDVKKNPKVKGKVRSNLPDLNVVVMILQYNLNFS